jgi:hypothetical protein
LVAASTKAIAPIWSGVTLRAFASRRIESSKSDLAGASELPPFRAKARNKPVSVALRFRTNGRPINGVFPKLNAIEGGRNADSDAEPASG